MIYKTLLATSLVLAVHASPIPVSQPTLQLHGDHDHGHNDHNRSEMSIQMSPSLSKNLSKLHMGGGYGGYGGDGGYGYGGHGGDGDHGGHGDHGSDTGGHGGHGGWPWPPWKTQPDLSPSSPTTQPDLSPSSP